MNACADWIAADFLHARGLEHDDPPCDHDPEDCPPLAPPTEETP
jgi:hypothetical protein